MINIMKTPLAPLAAAAKLKHVSRVVADELKSHIKSVGKACSESFKNKPFFSVSSMKAKHNESGYDEQFIIDVKPSKFEKIPCKLEVKALVLAGKRKGLKSTEVKLSSNNDNFENSLKGITYDSRVYLTGHCAPGSDSMCNEAGDVRISVQDYAKNIAAALKQSKAQSEGKPLTVSVLGCSAGSPVTAPYAKDFEEARKLKLDGESRPILKFEDDGTVVIKDSFAEKLAKELLNLDVKAEVKGRTHLVTTPFPWKYMAMKMGKKLGKKDYIKTEGFKHQALVTGDKVGYIGQADGSIKKVIYDYPGKQGKIVNDF